MNCDTHCNGEPVLRKQQRVKFVIKIVLVMNVNSYLNDIIYQTVIFVFYFDFIVFFILFAGLVCFCYVLCFGGIIFRELSVVGVVFFLM